MTVNTPAVEIAPTRRGRRTGTASGDSPVSAPRKPGTVTLTHFKAVDGARGVAILSVLLYHSGWSERGLFGVDAFFVISGFLITLLLIREAANNGRISFRKFYARRARRLLPPVVLTLGATLLLVYSMGTLKELEMATETALFSLLQVANWQQITSDTAYWEAAGGIIPLGQMWSLSVTEQFYLIWPLIIAALWFIARRKRGLMMSLLFVVLLAAGLVAPLLFDGTNSDRLYLGTDARAVSFVAGAAFAALVAWILQKSPAWAGPSPDGRARVAVTAISLISLGVTIGASVLTAGYHEPWLYQGGFGAISVTIALFISTLCFSANALNRIFEWKPFRQIGILSYSLFLLHLPVFWAIDRMTNGTLHPLVLFGVGTLVTWLVATIMHYVWSEPLRTARWKPTSAVVAIVVSFGLIVTMIWFLPIDRVNARPQASSAGQDQTAPGSAFPIDSTVSLPVTDDGTPLTVAVVGDSVAGNMYEALAEFSNLRAVDVTRGSCGIFDADSARTEYGDLVDTQTDCWPWQDRLEAANAESAPDVYILRNLWDANEQLIDGEWVTPEDKAWQDRYRSQLERLVEIGQSLEEPPLILLANDHPRDGALDQERLDIVNGIADEIIEKNPNVQRLNFAGAACPNGGSCATDDSAGQPLYLDGAHFTPTGMAVLGPWLENQIALALNKLGA